ncbi:methyl-accepting chemotaxis protein [Bdellovibrionota bacterium FG-2]
MIGIDTLKHWSVSKKLTGFAISLIIGAASILAIYLTVVKLMFGMQAQFKQAVHTNELFAELGTNFRSKAIAMADYIANPSDEVWGRKKKWDTKISEKVEDLQKVQMPEELQKSFEPLIKFDKKFLSPLDLTLKQALKTSTPETVLKIYSAEYSPLLEKLDGILKSCDTFNIDQAKAAEAKLQKVSIVGSIIVVSCLVFGSLFGFVLMRIISSAISRPLEASIEQLEQECNQTEGSATSIATASQQLASSSTEQASAIQQTAASMEEMTAMISKSAENASKSGEASNTSSDVAEKGKIATQQMIAAIGEISASNQAIMHEIEESNRQITEITHVIAAIGEKTKVINDIVFQTKLLSFNASVEAARAGEHGKGFAVVAEEVGNLARMSGTAAQEIGSMLDQSIHKVENIVTDTNAKVQKLISTGVAKVQAGTEIANQTAQVLEDIVSEVAKVKDMINEITMATREQSSGVGEITKAVGELESATQKDSQVSQDIASSANQLSTQSHRLKTVVESLKGIVRGSDNT